MKQNLHFGWKKSSNPRSMLLLNKRVISLQQQQKQNNRRKKKKIKMRRPKRLDGWCCRRKTDHYCSYFITSVIKTWYYNRLTSILKNNAWDSCVQETLERWQRWSSGTRCLFISSASLLVSFFYFFLFEFLFSFLIYIKQIFELE